MPAHRLHAALLQLNCPGSNAPDPPQLLELNDRQKQQPHTSPNRSKANPTSMLIRLHKREACTRPQQARAPGYKIRPSCIRVRLREMRS